MVYHIIAKKIKYQNRGTPPTGLKVECGILFKNKRIKWIPIRNVSHLHPGRSIIALRNASLLSKFKISQDKIKLWEPSDIVADWEPKVLVPDNFNGICSAGAKSAPKFLVLVPVRVNRHLWCQIGTWGASAGTGAGQGYRSFWWRCRMCRYRLESTARCRCDSATAPAPRGMVRTRVDPDNRICWILSEFAPLR